MIVYKKMSGMIGCCGFKDSRLEREQLPEHDFCLRRSPAQGVRYSRDSQQCLLWGREQRELAGSLDEKPGRQAGLRCAKGRHRCPGGAGVAVGVVK